MPTDAEKKALDKIRRENVKKINDKIREVIKDFAFVDAEKIANGNDNHASQYVKFAVHDYRGRTSNVTVSAIGRKVMKNVYRKESEDEFLKELPERLTEILKKLAVASKKIKFAREQLVKPDDILGSAPSGREREVEVPAAADEDDE